MGHFPPTIILLHRRENLKKCSLRGLEGGEDFLFLSYPGAPLPDLKNYCVLALDAPPLRKEDAARGIFLIDGTWRHTEKMDKIVPPDCQKRGLPAHFKTAYPRRQLDCPAPERGLASVEALYIAYHILGRKNAGILNYYYWKELFISTNFPHLS